MALNKSNKSTPSSRSGYLKEITASAGKTANFFLPVRIKVTPQHSGTLAPRSDGKKDYANMMQPVLIKDLLQSTQKNNTTLTSVSTQKKRTRAQRSTQPYLNTQSCYKAKENEDAESSFFGRKSYNGNKVRRQLYQTLDSPQKSTLDRKENVIKNVKTRTKPTPDSEVPMVKCSIKKNAKSLLLPPNSIKNSIIRKSGNFKHPGKQNAKGNASVINKSSLRLSNITETKTLKNNIKKSIEKIEDDVDMETQYSSSDQDPCITKESYVTRDVYTMTSPEFEKKTSSKCLLDLNKLNRPSVIVMSATKKVNNSEPLCAEMENLNINPTLCNQYPEFDLSKLNYLDINGMMQCKAFVEQSIQACEDQILRLKQVLNFVNGLCLHTKTMGSKTPLNTQLITNEYIKINEKCDISSNTNVSNQDLSDVTDIIENSKNKETEEDISMKSEIKVYVDEEESHTRTIQKLQISTKTLVMEADLSQETKEMSSNELNELARLSTIGEVSCETDELNKNESNKYERDENNESENKENIDDSSQMLLTPTILSKIPRTPRRKSITLESGERRRSARLAAKRRSLSMTLDTDFDKQDSFTLLENELNVFHDIKLPSKSLPASPMKTLLTPGGIRHWDKRVERPLQEYMALKMNGTFLVTPDVKRFQSCLEPTDTPHSRKSLSRKIFMELCDLYAESPEPK